jgi:hypothetical protein
MVPLIDHQDAFGGVLLHRQHLGRELVWLFFWQLGYLETFLISKLNAI